jgi:hypothetical protein
MQSGSVADQRHNLHSDPQVTLLSRKELEDADTSHSGDNHKMIPSQK